MEVIADTCWFIDLEKSRPEAIEYLRRNPTVRFVLTEIVRAELVAGGRDTGRIAALVGGADLLPVDEAVSTAWGDAARRLRAAGSMVGANDLWIAAIATANGVPVLTRNASDFGRIPGVRVVAY